jgi:hypothetical protein
MSSKATVRPSLSNQRRSKFQVDTIDNALLSTQIVEMESRLPEEQVRLQRRKQQMDACQAITEGILNKLHALESKAAERDTLIQPLHRAAQNLLQINENVERTLELLDFVMKQGEVAQVEERMICSEPSVETLPLYLQSLDRVNTAIRGMQERHVEFITHIMSHLMGLSSKAQRMLVERYQEWVRTESPDQDSLKQMVAIVGEDVLWPEHARVRSRFVISLLDQTIKEAKASEDNLPTLINAYKVHVERERQLIEDIFGTRRIGEILDVILKPSRDALMERFKGLSDKLSLSYRRADFNYSLLALNLLPQINVDFDSALHPAHNALKKTMSQFFSELLSDIKSTQVRPALVNPTLKTASHESIGLKFTALTTFATHLQSSAPTVSDRYALAANANIFDQTAAVHMKII